MEKVSILVPAYNSEKYIARCIESVLNQTYKFVELIIVDDGSTDNTAKIIKSYETKFHSPSMSLIYIYQENKGQAAAINKGLLKVTGDYVAWFDSDDILKANFICDLIETIKINKTNYALGQLEIVKENNLNKVVCVKKRKHETNSDDFFTDLICENNILYGNGTILVKTNYLFSVIPSRQIYESKEGQNWQLMLPITYKEKCGYLDKTVSIQVQRSGSHSRSKKTYYQKKERYINFSILLKETIKKITNISQLEIESIFKLIDIKYSKILFNLAFLNNKKEDAEMQHQVLEAYGACDANFDKQYKLLCKHKCKLRYYIYVYIFRTLHIIKKN